MAVFVDKSFPGRHLFLMADGGMYLYSKAITHFELTYEVNSPTRFVINGYVESTPEHSKGVELAMRVILGDKLAAYALAAEVLQDDVVAEQALTQLSKLGVKKK